MRLREILLELNTRSKKTAPNIFNEPINCGFEAEFIWQKAIKKKVEDTKKDDVYEHISKNWIKPHSLIKKIGKWDGEMVDNDSWVFASDISLYSLGLEFGVEMISPVYPNIRSMLTDMRSLFKWLMEEEAYANKSTGLHITMSMGEEQENDLNKLKLCVLAADANILDDFERSENRYAVGIEKTVIQKLEDHRIKMSDLKNIKEIEDRVNKFFTTNKYSSVNFKRKSRQTNTRMVEFRSAGGHDYMEEEDFYKIENSAKHYAVCLKAAYSDLYNESYISLLGRLIGKMYRKDEIEKYPFIELMREFMSHESYEYFVQDMKGAHGQKHNKEAFLVSFLQLCFDIGVKNASVKVKHHKIAKQSLYNFGFKNGIAPETIYNTVNKIKNQKGAKSYKNLFFKCLSGYNKLMKQDLSIEVPDSIEIKKKPFKPINIFKDGHIVFSELTRIRLNNADMGSEVYKSTIDGLFKFKNRIVKDEGMLIIPKEHMDLVKLAYNWREKNWLNYDKPWWEREMVDKISKAFDKIYPEIHPGSDIFGVLGRIDYNVFVDLHGEEGYATFVDYVGDYIDVNIVPFTGPPLLPAEELVGPNGESFEEVAQINENASIYRYLFNLERLCD